MRQTMIIAVFAAFVAILFPITIQAQDYTGKGNFMLGTAIGFSSNTSTIAQAGNQGEGPESFQWNLAPHIGYFLFDNFTLGIGLDL